MEQKYESKNVLKEFSGFDTESHIALAKQLRAEAIGGFMHEIGQRFKQMASHKKEARINAVSSNAKPCF